MMTVFGGESWSLYGDSWRFGVVYGRKMLVMLDDDGLMVGLSWWFLVVKNGGSMVGNDGR